MTLRRIPKLANDDNLPVVKLYLDDVAELVDILKGDDATVTQSIKFRTRDFECDSLEELEKVGGSTRSFELTVTNDDDGGWNAFRMDWYGSFVILSRDQDYWRKHAKIRELFESNSIWWKNMFRELVHRVPLWIAILLTGMGFLGPYILPGAQPPKFTFYADWPAWVFGVFIAYFVFSRGSVVVLRYAHAGGVKRWFRDHSTQLVLLFIAGVVGAILKELSSPITKWLMTHLGR